MTEELQREIARVAVLEETMSYAVRVLDAYIPIAKGDDFDMSTLQSLRNALDPRRNPRIASFEGGAIEE